MKRAKVFVLVAVLLLATLSMVACSGTNFSISFNSNGGTECASISTNGKAVVQMPADPTKEGFIFDGWFWDNEVWQKPFTINSLLDTPLSDNLTVYARWKEAVHTHVYRDWTITTPATCTATGIRTKTCACGDTVTEVIPAIGGEHAYGTWTETETGVTRECTRCPQKEFVPYTAGLQFGYVNVKGIMVQMVTGLGAASGAVYIPKTHDGKPVGGIGGSAFLNCISLTRIIIPSSVISIGNSAFRGCTSLSSITIPSTVTSIEGGNFGEGAFSGCTNLATVTFAAGSKLSSIGDRAFSGCTSLTSITIPSSVTSLGSAFSGCINLATVAFEVGSKLTSIGQEAFENCTSLAGITIPSSVTSIGFGSFSRCTSFSSITILSSVTVIGDHAFSGCINLATVTFEADSKLTSIGRWAFNGCTSLASISIQSSVTRIGWGAFCGCTSLASITIPSSVSSIDYNAFDGCTALTIYAELEAQPSGWDSNWKDSNRPVYWFSATAPTGTPATGNGYWHYVGDVPTKW